MFERFRAQFAGRREPEPVGPAWQHDRLAGVEGYPEFVREFGGATFSSGLFRVHDDLTGSQAKALVDAAFPEVAARVCPFGYDWLGRQFAVDADRRVGGQPLVLLLEPGTGEVLEIPVTFAAFHDEELVEFPDAALATEFFDSWSVAHPSALPLRRDQCVGYRVPLFLGGVDTVDNLEVMDLEVYWTICGQLRAAARNLPPGTSISEVAGR